MNDETNKLAATPFATESFYDRAKMHPDAMRAFGENAKTRGLMTPDAATQYVTRAWAPVFNRYDLQDADARGFVEIDAMAHGKAPNATTREKWAGQAKAALLATYGPNGAGQALADAQTFIRQDPQLRRLVDRGFGDHKAFVLMAARLGTQARKAGRIK